MSEKVNSVLEADIRKFFHSVEHAWLMGMIEHRIASPRRVPSKAFTPPPAGEARREKEQERLEEVKQLLIWTRVGQAESGKVSLKSQGNPGVDN